MLENTADVKPHPMDQSNQLSKPINQSLSKFRLSVNWFRTVMACSTSNVSRRLLTHLPSTMMSVVLELFYFDNA